MRLADVSLTPPGLLPPTGAAPPPSPIPRQIFGVSLPSKRFSGIVNAGAAGAAKAATLAVWIRPLRDTFIRLLLLVGPGSSLGFAVRPVQQCLHVRETIGGLRAGAAHQIRRVVENHDAVV